MALSDEQRKSLDDAENYPTADLADGKLHDALVATNYPEELYRLTDEQRENLAPPREYADDEIVKIDPTMGQPNLWIQPGARAVWLSKSGKQRLLVQIQGPAGTKVLIQTQDGQEFAVAPNTLHEWMEGDLPVGSTTAEPQQIKVDPDQDPNWVDPNGVERVVVKVRGVLQYSGPVTPEAGELLAMTKVHGRKMVVTLHMKDGTKRRYRGNGARIL